MSPKLAARSTRQPMFDLALLLRILHNLSGFGVTTAGVNNSSVKIGRYVPDEKVSDYFRLLGQVFPDMMNASQEKALKAGCWLPVRRFNKSALLLPNGKSLIDAITKISRAAIIEDGDLLPERLEEHNSAFKLDDVIVHDVSRHLRLSTNHVYVLTRKGMDTHLGGGTAWLN